MTAREFALWKSLARTHVELDARTQRAFSTDDLWSALAGLPSPDEPRALGTVMTAAADAGIIIKSPLVVPTRRKEAHSRPIAVWLSVPLSSTLADAAAYVATHTSRLRAPQLEPLTLPLASGGTLTNQ